MAAVTIETTAQNSYYAAANLGWSARSVFSYRTAIQQLVANSTANLGELSTAIARAQAFTPASAIAVNEIRVAVSKNGTPVDNLTCAIYSDTGANLPNASIQAADNPYAGAAISTTASWLTFQFATPVSLSASTKYWIVFTRSSGAADASHFYRFNLNTGSAYAGGGISISNAGVWGAESAVNDLAFQILTETPSALYSIVQDTSGLKLRAYKSTDSGATWIEQDSGFAPAVFNANYPYDACDTRSGPYLGAAFFTGTNTMRARLFTMSTDTWGTDLGAADVTSAAAASNERSVRITLDNTFTNNTCGTQIVQFSSSADDADLVGVRRTTSTWAALTPSLLSITSGEASLLADCVCDKSPIGFLHRFYYDVINDDFDMRSLTATTAGTQTALDLAAAPSEVYHLSTTCQIYQASNVDRVVVPYVDGTGWLAERTATLEVTSASVTLGTKHQLDNTGTMYGRQISSCEYDGDLYIVANSNGTGISYWTDVGATGTWTGTAWKSGLTNCTLSQAISIPGVGLMVAYTDNGTAVVDFIAVAGPPVTNKSDSDTLAVTISESESVEVLAGYRALVRTTTGLIGYWRLGEPSGTTVVDDHGALDGTSANVSVGVAGALTGDADTAYTFNGTTSYAAIPNDASLQLSTGSLEAWFKTTDAGAGYRGVVTKPQAWGIYLSGNVLIFFDFTAGLPRASAIDPTDGAWHHVVLTFQSGVANGSKLYLDGALILTNQCTVLDQTKVMSIGCGQNGIPIQQYAGSIDEVAVYGVVLDAATVLAHYTAGSAAAPVAKSDSDSLTVTATEVEAVAAAIPETDALAVTLTESETVSRINQRADSDTAAVTLTETEVVAATLATETDSLAVTIAESEAVARLVQKADSDSLAVTLTENNGVVAAAIADTDSAAVTATETEAIAATLPNVDTLAVTLTEAETVTRLNQRTDSDALAVTLTELDAVAAALADSDSLAVTISESESIDIVPGVVNKSDSDTLAVTATEAEALTAALAETDSLAVTATESDVVAAALPNADSLALTITESETVARLVQKTDSDSLALTITESESVDTTPEVIPKADTDSLAVTITESTGVVAAALAESDALAITASEVEAVRVFAADTDTADITLTESEAVRATLATETDTLAVTITESESVLKMRAKADTDSLAVTITEVSSVAKMIGKSDSDSLAVTITESTGSVAAQIADAEALAVELAEADRIAATLADVVVLDITLGEADQVHASITESDVVVLVITETGIVTIGVPGDVEFDLIAGQVLTFQTTVQDVLAYALEHGPALAMHVKGDYDGGD